MKSCAQSWKYGTCKWCRQKKDHHSVKSNSKTRWKKFTGNNKDRRRMQVALSATVILPCQCCWSDPRIHKGSLWVRLFISILIGISLGIRPESKSNNQKALCVKVRNDCGGVWSHLKINWAETNLTRPKSLESGAKSVSITPKTSWIRNKIHFFTTKNV